MSRRRNLGARGTNGHGQQSGGSEYSPGKSKKKKHPNKNIPRDLKTFMKFFMNYWINNGAPVIFSTAKDIFKTVHQNGLQWLEQIILIPEACYVLQCMLNQKNYNPAVNALGNQNSRRGARKRKSRFYRLIRENIQCDEGLISLNLAKEQKNPQHYESINVSSQPYDQAEQNHDENVNNFPQDERFNVQEQSQNQLSYQMNLDQSIANIPIGIYRTDQRDFDIYSLLNVNVCFHPSEDFPLDLD